MGKPSLRARLSAALPSPAIMRYGDTRRPAPARPAHGAFSEKLAISPLGRIGPTMRFHEDQRVRPRLCRNCLRRVPGRTRATQSSGSTSIRPSSRSFGQAARRSSRRISTSSSGGRLGGTPAGDVGCPCRGCRDRAVARLRRNAKPPERIAGYQRCRSRDPGRSATAIAAKGDLSFRRHSLDGFARHGARSASAPPRREDGRQASASPSALRAIPNSCARAQRSPTSAIRRRP